MPPPPPADEAGIRGEGGKRSWSGHNLEGAIGWTRSLSRSRQMHDCSEHSLGKRSISHAVCPPHFSPDLSSLRACRAHKLRTGLAKAQANRFDGATVDSRELPPHPCWEKGHRHVHRKRETFIPRRRMKRAKETDREKKKERRLSEREVLPPYLRREKAKIVSCHLSSSLVATSSMVHTVSIHSTVPAGKGKAKRSDPNQAETSTKRARDSLGYQS